MDIPGTTKTIKPRESLPVVKQQNAEEQFKDELLEIFNPRHNSETVLDIIAGLRAFNWVDDNLDSGTKRVLKPIVELDNGALY